MLYIVISRGPKDLKVLVGLFVLAVATPGLLCLVMSILAPIAGISIIDASIYDEDVMSSCINVFLNAGYYWAYFDGWINLPWRILLQRDPSHLTTQLSKVTLLVAIFLALYYSEYSEHNLYRDTKSDVGDSDIAEDASSEPESLPQDRLVESEWRC